MKTILQRMGRNSNLYAMFIKYLFYYVIENLSTNGSSKRSEIIPSPTLTKTNSIQKI